MGIKRILLPLFVSAGNESRINIALRVAKTLNAHVEALFIKQPQIISRSLGPSLIAHPSRSATTASALWTQTNGISESQTCALFTHACTAANVALLSSTDEPTSRPTATWRESEGPFMKAVLHRAAGFDLIIAASTNVVETMKEIAKRSLLQARRPVLLAPAHAAIDLLGSAMIAWDESPECWRAVSNAIPFFRVAKSVMILSIDRNANSLKPSLRDVITYLGCHGIEATTEVIAPDKLNSTGSAILMMAAQHEVGLIIMGAYSHNRLHRMLFGGTTRHILENASTRAILLTH